MITALIIAAGSWTVLACIGLPGCSFAANRLRRRARNYTDWSMWQPDVPALRTVSDEDWWAEQPPELWPDTAVDAEFVDLMWDEFPQYRRDFTGGAA